MKFDRAESQASRESSSASAWVHELLSQRQESTLGGSAVGLVRNLLDRGDTPEVIRSARAESNDEIAHIAADTAAFVMPKWLGAGAVRASLLINPHKSLTDNALGFGKNFLEGAALNKVGKLAHPEGAFARATAARFGRGLASESITHLSVGFGLGAVKGGFNAQSWKDSSGNLSITGGLENIAKMGGLGALINLPAGMIGTRISKAASVSLGRGHISERTAAMISGVGSGYAAGTVFGGADALMTGKGWKEVLAAMHKGGVVGGVTGGFLQGFHARKAEESRWKLASSSSTEANRETRFAAAAEAQRAKEQLSTKKQNLWEAADLDIRLRPTESLRALTARLPQYTPARETFTLPKNPTPKPFKDFADFAVQLKEVSKPARIYDVAEHTTKIVVPEEYARGLDEVRRLRLIASPEKVIGQAVTDLPAEYLMRYSMKERVQLVEEARAKLNEHPLKDRALPEDFIQLMDELPNRGLMKKLVLLDNPNPYDPWLREDYKRQVAEQIKQKGPESVSPTLKELAQNFESAAEASSEGLVTFFRANRGSHLRDQLLHEWAHLVKFKYGPESALFDVAASLEKDGWYASEYSRKNNDENFAVHLGERLLKWDADEFALVGSEAPLRSVALGRSLARVFASMPRWAVGPYHEKFNARLGALQVSVLPVAQEQLMHKVRYGDADTKQKAVRLLGWLGNESHIEPLSHIAKSSGNSQLASQALESAVQLARGRQSHFDLLFELSKPGSKISEQAFELFRRLEDYRVPQYRRYLEAVDGGHLSEMVKLVDSMPDAKGSQMVFDHALQLAGESRSIRSIVELIDRGPNLKSKELAFKRGLDILKGNHDQTVALALRVMTVNPQLRLKAIDVLYVAADPRAEQRIEHYTKASDPVVARRAKETLEKIDQNNRLDLLSSQVSSGSVESRVEAVRKLGQLHDLRAIRPLLEVAASDSPAVASEAASVLTQYSPTVVKFEARQLSRQNPMAKGRLLDRLASVGIR